jgi:RimJ/RimL family protein N-acetyltransferase
MDMQTKKIPGPAYRIVTRRLVIRCYNPADAPLMKASIDESLEHLRPWMPWASGEPQELQAKIEGLRRFRGQFDLGQNFVYGVFDLQETRLLGGAGLHPRVEGNALEIGYWIHKDFINQGFATEVSAALTKVAFEVNGVERMEIHCDPENARSAAIPRKLGYTHEATLRRRTTPAPATTGDSMIWTLFAEDYPSTPSATAAIQAYDAINRQIL